MQNHVRIPRLKILMKFLQNIRGIFMRVCIEILWKLSIFFIFMEFFSGISTKIAVKFQINSRELLGVEKFEIDGISIQIRWKVFQRNSTISRNFLRGKASILLEKKINKKLLHEFSSSHSQSKGVKKLIKN